jgi:hypothetical protein
MHTISIRVCLIILMFTNLVSAQINPVDQGDAEVAFKQDLKNAQLKIYVLGGIVPAVKVEDRELAEQLGFSYIDFGCNAPLNFAYYLCYNRYVFDHLIAKYGDAVFAKLNRQSFGYRDYQQPQPDPVPQE